MVAGVTTTDATGIGTMVIDAVAVCPSPADAVTVAVPTAAALTNPEVLTAATPVLEDVQVRARDTVLPVMSFTSAVS
jgi:hypothetical protein